MKESYRKDVASDPDSESCWAGRKAPARSQASRAGTGRSHSPPGGSDGPLERPVKENIRPAGKHGYGKSDEPIVSKKPANRIYKHHLEFAEAELAEIRGSIKRNTVPPGISRTQSRLHEMSPGLERVRQNARKDKKMKSPRCSITLTRRVCRGRSIACIRRLLPALMGGWGGSTRGVWRRTL